MLKVIRWVAKAPGLTSTEDWLKWSERPELPVSEAGLPRVHVPAAVNRRTSRLSRYALEVALEIAKSERVDYGIFASRHGEIDNTLSLLESIAKNEVLSPMAFSQSVHNVAAGLFTIIQQSQTKVTSICAGIETFDMALVEAASYLRQHPSHQVLVTNFDQRLPDFYQRDLNEVSLDFSLALLLSQGEAKQPSQAKYSHPNWPRALNFLIQFIREGASHVAYTAESRAWSPA